MYPANAETSDELGPYHIEITINEYRMNLSSLELARIILHEIIHAELFVAIYEKGGSPIDANFEANFNNYVNKYSEEGNSVIHHNYMAEKLAGKIGNVLKSIHPYLGKEQFLYDVNVDNGPIKWILPTDFYVGLAWKGLQETDMWRYNLPNRDVYIAYQDLASSKLNNFCYSN